MTRMKRIAAALLATVALAAANSGAIAQEGTKIFVVGGKADDPFFSVIKKGVDDAARAVEAYGGSVSFLQLQTYDQIGPDAANLVRTAINQGANGIAVPNWVPEAEDPAIMAARDAGIPVMIYNSGGAEKAKELGALNFIGSDEYLAGKAGGEYFANHGATKVICVNTVPGAANLEARCQGVLDAMTAAGKSAEKLPLPPTSFGNPTAVAEAIKAALLKDDTVDGIITISQADADSAANGIAQAGGAGRVGLGGFDMNADDPGPHQERHPALRGRSAALPSGVPCDVAATFPRRFRDERADEPDPYGSGHRRLCPTSSRRWPARLKALARPANPMSGLRAT